MNPGHLSQIHNSGCVVECRTCNREVAGSNLGRGYLTSRSTQPSIPPGSVNEYQLRLGKHRQVWLIPRADITQDVQVKLCYPLTMRAIPERLRDASCGSAIQIDCLYRFNRLNTCETRFTSYNARYQMDDRVTIQTDNSHKKNNEPQRPFSRTSRVSQ